MRVQMRRQKSRVLLFPKNQANHFTGLALSILSFASEGQGNSNRTGRVLLIADIRRFMADGGILGAVRMEGKSLGDGTKPFSELDCSSSSHEF
jgi:hypothetical protein